MKNTSAKCYGTEYNGKRKHSYPNAKTGKVAWTDSANHGRSFGSIVDAGAVLIALPSKGDLLVYKPDGAAYAEIARIKVAATATYAHPIVAGKRIFIKAGNALALLAIE